MNCAIKATNQHPKNKKETKEPLHLHMECSHYIREVPLCESYETKDLNWHVIDLSKVRSPNEKLLEKIETSALSQGK